MPNKECIECDGVADDICQSCFEYFCEDHLQQLDEGYLCCYETDCIRGLKGYD